MNTQYRIDKITDWLLDYYHQTGRDFVVGVSGGVDSAVVSTLCAMTSVRTWAVSMSFNGSIPKLAETHITSLQKEYDNVIPDYIYLDDIYKKFNEKFGSLSGISGVNLKSRLMMCALYTLSSEVGGLVVGTGNKVEDLGIGFFTKYGDGGVDLSPIGDLMKSSVYDMAAYLNISDNIIKAPPTDGLWGDSRTDEDQIGTSYFQLEWAMREPVSTESNERGEPRYIRNGADCTVHYTNEQKKALRIYAELRQKNMHKMSSIPVCKFT